MRFMGFLSFSFRFGIGNEILVEAAKQRTQAKSPWNMEKLAFRVARTREVFGGRRSCASTSFSG